MEDNKANETIETKDTIENNDFMLTTFDNPFNPFDDFDSWFMFDVENGYNSCSLLARITNNSNDLTELEEKKDIEKAIDEIIKYDFTNNYTKISKNGFINATNTD